MEIGKQQSWAPQYHLAAHSDKTLPAATVYRVQHLSRGREFLKGTCKFFNRIPILCKVWKLDMIFLGFEDVIFFNFRVDFRKMNCLSIFQILETCPESDRG